MVLLGTRAGPVGAACKWSLKVESAVLLISGRACEPLRKQDPRGVGQGVVDCWQRPLETSKAVWAGPGTVAALRLCVRGHWGWGRRGRRRDGYWLCDRESRFRNLQERGGEKRHKSVLQRNRPDHSWKEGKPLNQVLEIQAAGS